jgi:NADH dehydrogenase/NADH:ubiquinone oxidoreductase 75 kD subunit (chain G)
MNEVTLEIDGRKIKVEKGLTILEAAKGIGINIPTLCYHPLVHPSAPAVYAPLRWRDRVGRILSPPVSIPSKRDWW